LKTLGGISSDSLSGCFRAIASDASIARNFGSPLACAVAAIASELILLSSGPTAMGGAAIVADRYCVGEVFLAGDAAHEMPPTGDFGLNTGVQDVHNLTWKIAAVLRGKADPSLLDSYHAERQPLGQTITQNSLANALSMGRTARQSNVLPRREFLNEQGLIFGACYQSMAVVPDGTPAVAIDDPVTEYVPSARPGSRAPHVWLKRGNLQISTIDLFGPHFVLLAGSDGDAWRRAARKRSARRGLHSLPLLSERTGISATPTAPGTKLTASTQTARYWFDRTAMSRGAAVQAFRIR
jgi:FAD binding domain